MTLLHSLWTSLFIVLAASLVVADDQSPPKNSPRVAEAFEHVSRVEMKLADGKPDELLKVSENPFLTFGDAARDNEAGTLWAWSNGGRPVAMMELYRSSASEHQWVHAMTMTSPTLVRMTSKTGLHWTPKKSDFEPRDLPGNVNVGDTPVLRFRQMKDQARRFSAHEFWDPNNSRFELRLLIQPVHRYVDSVFNVVDGAVFVFAHGTNPEALLFVEAVGTDAATVKWHFAFARLGSAEIHVELDGDEVWTRERTPGVVGRPDDSYWLFFNQLDEK